MSQIPKNLAFKDIEIQLKLRGVCDEHVKQFMEELHSNEYDYDAILNDVEVSDPKQSFLLDFFKDELNDESLFYIY